MMDYSVAPLLCKVLVIGNSGVGKTAFLFRYFKDTFDSVYESTIGIDYHSKVISTKNGQRVKLQVWDTAGQERYRAITAAYYRGAVAFILMFDLTNKATFEACKNWIVLVNENCGSNYVLVLVGNKSDLKNRRCITLEDIEKLSEARDISGHFEISAKEDINVKEVMHHISEAIIDVKSAKNHEENEIVYLYSQPEMNQKKCSC